MILRNFPTEERENFAVSISIQREIHICHLELNESRNRLLIWNESDSTEIRRWRLGSGEVSVERILQQTEDGFALEMRLDFQEM